MQARYRREAPAKINLSLHVTGRRADGYHLLDSIFLPLALCDDVRLELEPADEPRVSCACSDAALAGDENLAARAARAYLARAGRGARVRIAIDKHIWVAAGLGGGSSDAGAVLRLLEDHFGALGPGPLAELALSLGADVPFFVAPAPARARGVGERLAPLGPVPPLPLVLLNPGRPLTTAAVYRALELDPLAVAPEPPDPLDLEAACRLAVNDLAPAARRMCPEIDEMVEILLACGARAASMSGSGPTVFGIFATGSQASAAADKIRKTKDFRTLVTRSLGA